jgi:RNA-directed DNA polymerase
MALDGLETELRRKFKQAVKFQLSDMVNLVRYADDFIITGRSKEMLENEVKPLIAKFLGERGLELSPEKTSITHIDQGFDFLGFNVRKYNGKLLIMPSKKNVHVFLAKVRDQIKVRKQATQAELLAKLNPLLRGWAQYYRSVAAKRTFKTVDKEIWKALWSWAKRRHPQKGIGWVLKRYFKARPGCKWRFAVKRGRDTEWPELFMLNYVPIVRHVRIKAEANPFDPRWELYFERRDQRRAGQLLPQRAVKLWWRQRGRCPVCRQKLHPEVPWHIHHVVWRVAGGSDRLDNLALLHPNCHRHVHSRENPLPSRVFQRAFEGLELDEVKVSRPVLRGREAP